MYILTNKALKEREEKAYMKGNHDATKAWQSEFELQARENKQKRNDMLSMIEKVLNDDIEIFNAKTRKDIILFHFEEKVNELMDLIKMLRV